MFFMALFHANKGVIMRVVFYGFIAGMILFNGNLFAQSVWTEDGSLVITDSTADVYIENGRVQYQVEVSEDESTFVYGKNELTVCMPTQDGSICF